LTAKKESGIFSLMYFLFLKEVCNMMNLTFAAAYGFLIIAIILGILTLGPEKNSALCRGKN
jgi:hypothetical protein